MDKLASMHPSNPAFPSAYIELQTSLLKANKWENVMALGLFYRKNFLIHENSFRIEPVLMEAYSLIQFCHFEDAHKVLELGEFYAKKFNRQEDLAKIQKAQELKKLSKLYLNANPPQSESLKFSENELEWQLNPDQIEILKVLDMIKVRTESQCRS